MHAILVHQQDEAYQILLEPAANEANTQAIVTEEYRLCHRAKGAIYGCAENRIAGVLHGNCVANVQQTCHACFVDEIGIIVLSVHFDVTFQNFAVIHYTQKSFALLAKSNSAQVLCGCLRICVHQMEKTVSQIRVLWKNLSLWITSC